ncbi:MAG TPA: efflux transporter outer membrane subunit [Kiritimatiellia bacterium]|nr:efflux transporter outer membrane subunit [Kiritimatiellia bacterium]
MSRLFWGWPLVMIAFALGCARLAGPDYVRPDTPVPDSWTAPSHDDLASIRPDWWNYFDDPQLTSLIEQALAGNFDLRVAAGRVTRAEAQAGLASSRRLPVLGIGGGGSFGVQDVGQGTSASFESYEISAGLNWEIDIWGKLKKGQAAADAEIRASGADWRSAYLIVASEVAYQYFRLRQLDELTALYARFISTGERILVFYEARAEEQLVSVDMVLRQQSELLRLRREAMDLQRERKIVENGLAALIGRPAGELRVEPELVRDRLQPAPVPSGLPSELIERRPDILAAEYRVLAAYNLAGQARLDRLPTIALTGSGGSSSSSLGGLLNQWLLGGGPAISIPLFDPSKKRQIEVRQAEMEIASDQYRGTVIRAFQEVENSLVNLASRRSQSEQAIAALDNLKNAQEINQIQFEEGLLSQLQVLESERSLMQSEQVVLDLHFRLLAETVMLYKALGGGWPMETPR